MDKIRIGKDIRINWEITSTDESVILSKDNLTLEMTVPSKCVAVLPFTFNDNVLSAVFYGIDQTQLGNYWLTVWYKRNEVGQSALDKVLAFQLVRSTEEETHNDESIAYAEVNLSGTLEINNGGGGSSDTYTKEEIDSKVSELNGEISGVSENLSTHVNNTNIHVTTEDKTRWDAKQDSGDYATNTYVNTELAKKQNVGDYATNSQLSGVSENLSTHTSNTTIHVTAADKESWNGKQDALDFEFESMTQAEYDDLVTKDNNTLYFITQ